MESTMPAEASVRVRTLFSPFDATSEEYLAFVQSATRSIFLQIYGYHLPALGDTLVAKHQAGVNVNVILDHSQAEGKAEVQEVQKLVAAGVPLLIGTSPVHGQILHSKFTVIDESAVESGSWNYSLSASAQSNTLTFVHDPDYARAYLDHFHRIRMFIIMHDAIYQPKGAVTAGDVPAVDVLTDTTATQPARQPAKQPASQRRRSHARVSASVVQ